MIWRNVLCTVRPYGQMTRKSVCLSLLLLLLTIGCKNPEELIKKLNDPDPKARLGAARELGEAKDPQAIEPLIALMTKNPDDSDDDLIAARALGSIGAPAVERLIGILKSESSTIREKNLAIEALGITRDRRAVTPLLVTLGKDQSLRSNTMDALGEIGDPSAVEPLIALLNDSDSMTSGQAAEALGKFRDPRAVSALIGVLNKVPQSGRPASGPANGGLSFSVLRQVAAHSLAESGDTRAAESLDEALKKRDLEVVEGAYGFFIGRGESGSEPVLIAALEGSANEEMATAFLNWGNDRLEFAAERWAIERNYKIVKSVANDGMKWGSKR